MVSSTLTQVLDMHESTENLLISISGSLGSLLAVAVLVCGILIVVIVVISRKKGMQQQHYLIWASYKHEGYTFDPYNSI